MNNKIIALISVVVVIFTGVGFLGGMYFQKSRIPANFSRFNPGGTPDNRTNGAMRGNQGPSGFRPTTGQVISIDGNSLKVKTSDGSNKIVILSDSTKINMTSEGSATDLVKDLEITIFGTESNGTITAQNINIGGQMFGNSQPNVSPTNKP